MIELEHKQLHGFMNGIEQWWDTKKSLTSGQLSSKQANFASDCGLAFKEVMAQIETPANEKGNDHEAPLNTLRKMTMIDGGMYGISRDPNGNDYVVLVSDDSIYTIYKADGFTQDNPAYVVKGNNAGRPYEKTVNIKNVDTNNASEIEMAALLIHSELAKTRGKLLPLMSLSAPSIPGSMAEVKGWALGVKVWTCSASAAQGQPQYLRWSHLSGEWEPC